MYACTKSWRDTAHDEFNAKGPHQQCLDKVKYWVIMLVFHNVDSEYSYWYDDDVGSFKWRL